MKNREKSTVIKSVSLKEKEFKDQDEKFKYIFKKLNSQTSVKNLMKNLTQL